MWPKAVLQPILFLCPDPGFQKKRKRLTAINPSHDPTKKSEFVVAIKILCHKFYDGLRLDSAPFRVLSFLLFFSFFLSFFFFFHAIFAAILVALALQPAGIREWFEHNIAGISMKCGKQRFCIRACVHLLKTKKSLLVCACDLKLQYGREKNCNGNRDLICTRNGLSKRTKILLHIPLPVRRSLY